MVYIKRDNTLDLDKVKVTDYKFNKFVHLPVAQEVTAKAKHEVRRAAMEKVFKESCPQSQVDTEAHDSGKEEV